MMKFLTVSLIYQDTRGSNNKACNMLTITHAPCAEDPLINEFANPTAAPTPVTVCMAAVFVVVLYLGPEVVDVLF